MGGLMEDTAKALEALDGCMYTGCDLNTNDLDMDYLTEATGNKYVLAGRDSKVDTNIATAASVIGSILGVIDAKGEKDISEMTFTVQGCGKRGPFLTIEMLFTYQRVFLVPVPSWQILSSGMIFN